MIASTRPWQAAATPAVIVIIAIALAAASPAWAEFRGAANILSELNDAAGADLSPDEQNAQQQAREKLRTQFEVYKADRAKLTGDRQVAQWLAMYDLWVESGGPGLTATPDVMFDLEQPPAPQNIGLDELVSELPNVDHWEALARAIEARPLPAQDDLEAMVRAHALRLIGHHLANDADARMKDVEGINAAFAKIEPDANVRASDSDRGLIGIPRSMNSWMYGRGEETSLEESVKALNVAMLFYSSDGNTLVATISRQLDNWKASEPAALQLPDLVPLIGKEQAAAILEKAFSKKHLLVSISGSDATMDLARKVAIEKIETMQTPQWQLCEAIDAWELYEAMHKKFGDTERSWELAYAQAEAMPYYAVSLIARDKSDEAARLIRTGPFADGSASLNYGVFNEIRDANLSLRVFRFAKDQLAEDPSLPLWNLYTTLAAQLGKTDELIPMLESRLKEDDVSSEEKDTFRSRLASALLAANRIEEGVKAKLELLEVGLKAQESEGAAAISIDGEARQLVNLGLLLKKPELVERGLSVLKQVSAETEDYVYNFSYSTIGTYVDSLMKAGKYEEAESVIAELLKRHVTAVEDERDIYGRGSELKRELLIVLAWIYHKAGRPQDIVTLLDEAPYWSAGDVAGLLSEEYNEERFAYIAAKALADTGNRDAAIAVATGALQRHASHDSIYALLVELLGDDAMPLFHEAFERNRFEERPLIWQAILHLRAKRLDEAETTIRRAIAIDPSDGDSGKGDRLRAYSVLADILEAKGNVDDANDYRTAVTAIRLSEDADDYWDAGLISQSIEMYEESLGLFSDAYCVQSRLALRLSEQGKDDEAIKHYERAYELMPDSFGFVESHCFGCEGIFSNPTGMSVADRVFSRLIETRPDVPQVQYLMGQLREAQQRHEEALAYYLRAAEIDPDYLNAWRQILNISGNVRLDPDVYDRAVFAMFRLAPQSALSRYHEFQNVTDLQTLYRLAYDAASSAVKQPENLYRLEASAKVVAKDEAMLKQVTGGQLRRAMHAQDVEPASPSAQAITVVMANAIINCGVRLIDAAR